MNGHMNGHMSGPMSRGFLARRSTALELMDTELFSFAEFRGYLEELERINTWTLAYRPTLSWLKQALSGVRQERPVSILDVGSGNGDMLRQIWRWAKQRGIAVELCGVDRNPGSKDSAELATAPEAPIRFETADVFGFKPARRFDFIICSLFTHHLTDEQNVLFLRWLEEHALRGWFINDLHRHPVPYFFVRHATRLFGRNLSVRHDSQVSVARAFTAGDWQRLLDAAGIPVAQTRTHWFFPFRYCVAHRKPPALETLGAASLSAI